jgi:hypothetical protein
VPTSSTTPVILPGTQHLVSFLGDTDHFPDVRLLARMAVELDHIRQVPASTNIQIWEETDDLKE